MHTQQQLKLQRQRRAMCAYGEAFNLQLGDLRSAHRQQPSFSAACTSSATRRHHAISTSAAAQLFSILCVGSNSATCDTAKAYTTQLSSAGVSALTRRQAIGASAATVCAAGSVQLQRLAAFSFHMRGALASATERRAYVHICSSGLTFSVRDMCRFGSV